MKKIAYAKAIYRQLESTIASKRNMRIALVNTCVRMRLILFSWSSIAAYMFEPLVFFRIFLARFFKMTGAYVSGMKMSGSQEAPARIRATQNVQRQVITDMNAEIEGPITGPKVVAAINMPIARPRGTGSL